MQAWLGWSDWRPPPKLPRATNPLWLVPESEPLVVPNPLLDGTFHQSAWRLPARLGRESAAPSAKFVPCGAVRLPGFLSLFFEDPNSTGRPHPHPACCRDVAACKSQP